MALDFSALMNEVDANDTVDGSAIALINGMAAEILTLKGQVSDPAVQAQLQTFADRLLASRTQLALAVTNNTPVQVPPTPIPDTSGSAGVDQQQAAQRAAQRSNPGGLGGSPRP